MAAVYVKVAPDLTIDDAESLKNSAKRMSANIQDLESEKDASIADLRMNVADLEEHTREVASALERAKSEKGISGGSAESIIETMRQMKKDHDAAVEKIRAERKEDMDRMRKVVDNLMCVMRIDSETIAELEAEVEKTSEDE